MSTLTSSTSPLEWAFNLQDLPVTPKFVLVVLAKHASTTDYTCWPSIEKVASMCGIKRRAAQYALADLIHSGHVVISGWKEWGAPIFKLAVGKAVRWLGRLRKAKQPEEPPPVKAQGALFYALSASFHVPRARMPMHQVHPEQSKLLNSPSEHTERERVPQAPSPSVEHVSLGNGYKVTVNQFAGIQEHFGPRWPDVLKDILRYSETNPIRDFYAFAMQWRVKPLPIPRNTYGRTCEEHNRETFRIVAERRAAKARQSVQCEAVS